MFSVAQGNADCMSRGLKPLSNHYHLNDEAAARGRLSISYILLLQLHNPIHPDQSIPLILYCLHRQLCAGIKIIAVAERSALEFAFISKNLIMI